MKNERGITLIALIITVIVLLILAGVAISIAINGGDIFGKASTARAEWNVAVEKENSAIQDLLGYLDANGQTTPEPVEDPYGGLATEEEIQRCKSLYTYEIITSPSNAKVDGTFELGEIADTSDKIKLADNTPKGTAKVTGIDWASIVPGKNPETDPAEAFSASDLAEYNNAVKKLVIPAEVMLDDEGHLVESGGKMYTIVTFDDLYGDFYAMCNGVRGAHIEMARGSSYDNNNNVNAETYLIIPSTIRYFEDSGIAARNYITIAPNSQLTTIDSYAFANTKHFKKIIIPSGVTSIGSNAFSNCYSLRQVYIPKTVETIGEGAFYNTGEYWPTEDDNYRNDDCGTFHVTFYYEGTEAEWNSKGFGGIAWQCPGTAPSIYDEELEDNIYFKYKTLGESPFAEVKFNQTVESMEADNNYVKYGDWFDYSDEFDYPEPDEYDEYGEY